MVTVLAIVCGFLAVMVIALIGDVIGLHARVQNLELKMSGKAEAHIYD